MHKVLLPQLNLSAVGNSNTHLERYCDEVDEVTGAMDAIAVAACLEELLPPTPLDTMAAAAPDRADPTGVGETPPPAPPLPPSPSAPAICSCCPLFPISAQLALMFPDTDGNILAAIVLPTVAVNRAWSVDAAHRH